MIDFIVDVSCGESSGRVSQPGEISASDGPMHFCKAKIHKSASNRRGGATLNSPFDHLNSKFPEGTYTALLTSDSAGWRSLNVRVQEQQPYGEPIKVPAFRDPAICLLLDESVKVDSFSKGRWRGMKQYFRGTGTLHPVGHESVVRLHLEGQRNYSTLILILPQETVDFVAQEVCKPGSKSQTVLSEIPFLDDPVITSFGSSVVAALKGGAPDFYAQASAHWLAAHLLLGSSRGFEWHKSLARERVSDYRLIRVLEYIDAHLSDHLDLQVLSREAGISQFHFAALFRKAVGTSPHRHVLHLRMQAARSMLCHTDKSALEIALTCGFRSASHFAAAFRRQFSQSPTEFRSSQQSHNKFRKL
jgi:AraC family transcriptional regulator